MILTKEEFVFTKIINVNLYKTFEEYLIDKGLKNCLPGMPNMEHAQGGQEPKFGELMYDTIDKMLYI